MDGGWLVVLGSGLTIVAAGVTIESSWGGVRHHLGIIMASAGTAFMIAGVLVRL